MDKKQCATLDQIREMQYETFTVRETSELFGVHPDTIRRWERKGHLKCLRHPINNYRLFRRSDLKGHFDDDDSK